MEKQDNMDKEAATQLATLTVSLFKESRQYPFPYKGIRKLLRLYPKAFKDLIPDLDWYESTVAGYSSRADTFQSWPLSDAEQAVLLLSKSFYEKHPEYLQLRELLTEVPSVGDLSHDIEVHEKMRQSLLKVLGYRLGLSKQT